MNCTVLQECTVRPIRSLLLPARSQLPIGWARRRAEATFPACMCGQCYGAGRKEVQLYRYVGVFVGDEDTEAASGRAERIDSAYEDS